MRAKRQVRLHEPTERVEFGPAWTVLFLTILALVLCAATYWAVSVVLA